MTSSSDTELSTPRSSNANAILLLVVATLLALVPFINKPFHIDDPLFVWGARHIRENFLTKPFDFYGFEVLWSVRYKPMHMVMHNPPVALYYLATASLLGGWSELWLHAACLIPAAGVVLGTWRLGMGMTRRPLLAGLAVLCTPVFMVSSTNVMCDNILMACLWVWSVVLWRDGLQQSSQPRLMAAAVLIGIAILTKYFAFSLIPLLTLYTIAFERRASSRLLWLLIPFGILTTYHLWTNHLYGHGLFTTAAVYARESYQRVKQPWTMKLFGTLSFTGACLLCVLFYSGRLSRNWRLFLVGIGMAALLTGGLRYFQPSYLKPDGVRPTSWDLAVQGAFLAVAGIGVLWLSVTDLWDALRRPPNREAVKELSRPVAEQGTPLIIDDRTRVADSLLLGAWVAGTMIFVGSITWMVNGRGVLPLVPAAALLLCRGLDRNLGAMTTVFREAWPMIPAAAISLIVAHADYCFATTQRLAAETITQVARKDHVTLWFSGHWGLQYYMQQAGAQPVHEQMAPLEMGDLFVLPENNDVYIQAPAQSILINRYRFPMSNWASTHQPSRCTGFYSDSWGVLPFALGPELNFDPNEQAVVRENPYDIYRLHRLVDRVIREPRKKSANQRSPE